jgi:DNA modification methylase
MKLSELKPDPRNANKGTERGRAAVKHSISELGAGRSILVDRNGVILAGNKTASAAESAGIDNELIVVTTDGSKLVVVQRTDLDASDPKAKELAIADNRTAELGLEWDADVLKDLAGELDLAWYFDGAELQEITGFDSANEETQPEPKNDKAEELLAKWKVQRGDLFEIPSNTVRGERHYILCGSSADASAVARLFQDGKKASLYVTDPPYGVGYGVDSGADSAQRFTAIEGDNLEGKSLQAFLESVFSASLPVLSDNAAWYLWHAQLTQGFFAAAAAAAAAGLLIHRQIIWSKNHFILGHGDFHWQHELCFYGWRAGHRARWFGDRSQSTVWEIARPGKAIAHPTEKPVELFARAIRLSTLPGEICYEPFSGSGTQLLAAEQEARLCRAMEIEPKYVAVALERMKDAGLEPQLVRS